MAKLIEVIEALLADVPNILTMDDSVYIRGRRIAPDVSAKIAPTDDEETENDKGWYLLEVAEFIQEHVDEMTAAQTLEKLQERGWLRQDREVFEMLENVVTASEVSELFGVKEDTVRDACQHQQILRRKSGATWLMLRYDAERRWGKK